MSDRLRSGVALALAGLLAGCALAGPQGSSLATPSPRASELAPATMAPSTDPTAAPQSASATPAPDPAVMDLVATGCPGGVVLEWTPSTHPNFHHYTALRSTEEEIPPDYPPIAPAVDWGTTYGLDRYTTSAVDGSILPSSRTWNYRVVAYDILGDVVSVSPVRSAQIGRVADLGTPELVAGSGGRTTISWQPFTGSAACFSAYRVMLGIGGVPNSVLTVVSEQKPGSVETDALRSGTVYQLRIDGIRSTTMGDIVVGRSETVVYIAP